MIAKQEGIAIMLLDIAWNDPGWVAVYVAILAVIAGGITSIAIYLKQKQQSRKEITYGLISVTSILSVSEEVKGKVKVLYDNKPVSNVSLVIMRVWNSGNVPIIPTDYLEQIKFNFGTGSEILDAQILGTIPSNIRLSLKWDDENVVLEPFLLNKNEAISLKVLLSQFNDEIQVDGRIVGTEQVAESGETSFVYASLVSSIVSTTAKVLPVPLVGSVVEDIAYKYFRQGSMVKQIP